MFLKIIIALAAVVFVYAICACCQSMPWCEDEYENNFDNI
jgi:hypothetical protein